MSGVPRPNRVLLVALLALAIACAGQGRRGGSSDPPGQGGRGGSLDPPGSETEITRDRAIEIARQQVSFQPDNIDTQPTTANERRVWRVTMRGRLPGQPPGLFETAVVTIDRSTGEVVSIART
jgi:hypothetical protein